MRTRLRQLAALTAVALCAPLVAAQDVDRARLLAATCATCHGTFGRPLGNIDGLAGVPADKIVSTVAAFRSGDKPSTIMGQIAKGFSDDEIRQIATWFAAQKANP